MQLHFHNYYYFYNLVTFSGIIIFTIHLHNYYYHLPFSGYGPRPPMFMGHRGGPPMPPHMHGPPHPMRGGLHMLMQPRYPPPHFHNHPQGWRDEWDMDPVEGCEEEEYAGLMLQREKDWVIKIQLLQLQTDNPYLDDFYYTVSYIAL